MQIKAPFEEVIDLFFHQRGHGHAAMVANAPFSIVLESFVGFGRWLRSFASILTR
jgi:hypothetical protein